MTTLNNILRAAAASPQRIAYHANGETVTYGELAEQSRRYADLLKRQGTSPVVLFGRKSVRTVVSVLACLRARRAYVPVGAFTPLSRLQTIVRLTGATLIISDAPVEAPGAVCCPLPGLERFAGGTPAEPENEIAYMIFTSGSTGEPKGVPISYGNLDNFTEWICGLEPLCGYRAVSVLNQADFSFDLSVADLFYALCSGHTLICGASGEDYNAVFDALCQVDVAVVTPTFMRMCLLNRDFRAAGFPRLRCVYFCGETLEPTLVRKLFEAFPAITVINAYGPTEATSAVSAVRITPELAQRTLLPVGETGSCATTVEIDDGEIVLKGPSVFGGYLNGYEGGHFIENGVNCYRTGDLGHTEDGMLYCRGRKDSQIKYKGYRIELNEIEYHLGSLPGVDDCAVVAKRDEAGAVRMIKAFYTGQADAQTVRAALQTALPPYMIPKLIRQTDRLPVNANGKIDRKALSE